MGNWNITVRGVGCHHNQGLPTDADRMAARFVKELKDAGHSIASATITHGAETDVIEGGAYEAERAKSDKPKSE